MTILPDLSNAGKKPVDADIPALQGYRFVRSVIMSGKEKIRRQWRSDMLSQKVSTGLPGGTQIELYQNDAGQFVGSLEIFQVENLMVVWYEAYALPEGQESLVVRELWKRS